MKIKPKILLVHANKAEGMNGLASCLQQFEVELISTFSSEEALAILSRDLLVAAAIINVHKSETDGFEFAQQIVNLVNTKKIPMILFSTNGLHNESKMKSLRSSQIDIMSKLDLPEILHSRVKIILDNFQLRAELQETQDKLKQMVQQINELKKETQIAQKIKSEFLTNMSHEIRTPLNGVTTAASLLLDTQLSEEQFEYTNLIRSSADALLAIVTDILDFSKIDSGKLELEELDFNLHSTIEDVNDNMALRAHQQGLELNCIINPDVPQLLKGDPGRLRQILVNLIGNAIKFTRQGEIAIDVGCSNEDASQATLSFSIKDTGIGIPEDKIAGLFASFSQVDASTTRKFGGAGLGLAISKQLIELMQGAISVESEKDQGSTFQFSIRLKKQIKAKHSSLLVNDRLLAAVKNVRILAVDDNATNRQALRLMFTSWKCRFDIAADAKTALKKLHEADAENDPFHIVITDMLMPEISGEQLGKLIKQEESLKETSLVMMTSLGSRGDVKRLETIGFSAYLTKPLKQSQLFDCLMTILNQRQGKSAETENMITRHTIAENRKASAKILLAEDNLVNQRVALRLLSKFGYCVEAVPNGRAAVKSLVDSSYDLVLMDIQMPEMDGFEATSIIRNQHSIVKNHNIPIIAMTAHALKGDKEKCLAAGMDDYVSKPIDPDELVTTVRKWLSGNGSTKNTKIDKKEEIETVIFDRKALLERVGGNEQFLTELLVLFLDEVPKLIKAIDNSIDINDEEVLYRSAHTLKGSAGNISALELYEVSLQLEQAAKVGDLLQAREVLKTVKQLWAKFKNHVNLQVGELV